MYHLALLNGYVCLLKIILPTFPECKSVPHISLAAIPDKDGPWYLALSLDVNTDCTYFPGMNSEQFKQLRCNGKRELKIPLSPGKHWNKRSLSCASSWPFHVGKVFLKSQDSESYVCDLSFLIMTCEYCASDCPSKHCTSRQPFGIKTRAHRFAPYSLPATYSPSHSFNSSFSPYLSCFSFFNPSPCCLLLSCQW